MKANPPNRLQGKRKMILLLGLLLIAGFLTTSMISYLVSRSSIRNTILNNELPLTSDNIYSEIQRDLLRPIFISSLMANDTFLKNWVIKGERDLSEIKQYLAEIKNKYQTITAFYVSDKTGNYYYPQGILKQVSPEEPRDAWYYRLKSMAEPYEINVDPDMANKDTMTIFINYQVYDAESRFIGATGVGLEVNMVNKLINTYRSRYNRNIYFFDHKGALILSSSAADPITKPISHITEIKGLERLSNQILAGDLVNFEYQQTDNHILLNVRFIPDLNWLLVVEQAGDNTGSILKKTLLLNLTICLVISFIVLGIIRITIIRYQHNLETRNQELEEKNRQISSQRSQLENQTTLLEQANKELEALNREKDEFVGITAHDLKSPLNAVVGFAELISRNEKADQESREIASYILESSLNMVDRINNLLDVGEIEREFELRLAAFDFREPVNKTIKDFKFQAQAKDIELKPIFPDEPFPTLGHEKWMVEIVGNLVSNAIKYSPLHSTVILNLSKLEQTIRLEVIDQGVGIPPAELPKLFKKYSRASTKPTAGESSSGLGLYIVKKMCRRMRGSAWCESEVGKGSRFIVEFPAA